MELIIVESPTKSKTIQVFLGKEYKVLSSFGHVRDLPKSELGVDVENDFTPRYVIPPKARKTIKSLKEESKKAEAVILACDEDREGEAIAWHISQVLNLEKEKPFQRIVFHEITKGAVEEALKNPRKLNMDLVDAQQTRRILDRIVGYKLSPFLWKKIARGLSAGRVQSVAVRLVVEREREIEKFVPQEYWSVEALLQKPGSQEFKAGLFKKDGKKIEKLEIKSSKEAEGILEDLKNAEYLVEETEGKEVRRNPLPPFTTSTMQQEAWKKFHFPARLTMALAQQLYENGIITYHRTDSFNIAESALSEARIFIEKKYGEKFSSLRRFKTKSKGAQEAHEAIRPSYPQNDPEQTGTEKKLNKNQFRLYDLVWRRFIACQMKEAVFNSSSADISAENYSFRANGMALKFEGFLKVYPMSFEENKLPELEKGDKLNLIKLERFQHFTQPAPRYTEASLIKALEENEIGRPSTYAPILSTVQARNYIEKDEKRRFKPTEIGTVVNDLLVEHFPEVVDIKFTAEMERDLDKIAQSQMDKIDVLKEFYWPFEKNLAEKYEEVSKKTFTEKPTERECPECKSPLLIRLGRFGKFYACSNFPKCKYTESFEKSSFEMECPKCLKGKIREKRTKRKKMFYGCSNWPECDFATWDKPTGKLCQECGFPIIETKKGEIKCSNKECKHKK